MRVQANRRIVLTLLALAALAVCALAVLSPRSTATPQTEPSTCCSSPAVSSATASGDIVPADMQADPTDPPGTIDGAKNPELIPDEVALRMIVLAVAEPADATDEAKERARAKLNPVGFNEDDAAAFLGLLGEFQTQADGLDKQAAVIFLRAPIPHTASTDYQALLDLGRQKEQLVADTVAALPARLSADGLEKLQAFLPEGKKGMKIIPDMPMPE